MSSLRPSRRDFLMHAASLGAGGLAVPGFWTGSQAAQQSANDRLNVAAIGVGGRGSGIGHEAGGRGNMVACCDVDRAHAERFAQKYGGRCKVYTDYRKLLDKEKLDAVTIGTPDHWHTKIAIEALKAGCHVYCEKPLTLTIDEGKLLCKVVRQTGRVFQVGTQQRSDRGRFLTAVALARSGRLGKRLTATCSIGAGPAGGPFPTEPPPKGLDWDFWLGQAPKVEYCRQRCHGTFRWWLEYSGGKLTDWGAHHVDIAQWGLGFEHSGPIQIEGEGDFPNLPADFDPEAFFAGRQKIPNGYNTATRFAITLRFANGSTIIVRHGPDNGIWFQGDQGEIFVNRRKLSGKPVEELTAAEKDRLEEQIARLYKGMPFSGHMGNFFDCVRQGREPVSDVFTHHRALSSCHMCNIAMLLGRKLQWDPDQEMFVGDAQANALLSRPQRKGYEIQA